RGWTLSMLSLLTAAPPCRFTELPPLATGCHHPSCVRLPTAAPVVIDVRSESPRRRELAELLAHHRLGDEHRDVLPAVMHGDRVSQHRRAAHATPGPARDAGLVALHRPPVPLLPLWVFLVCTSPSLPRHSLPCCALSPPLLN